MLPMWLVAQVFFARFLGGESVAYWAHVGGFAFGVTVAAVLRVSGADEWLASASYDSR